MMIWNQIIILFPVLIIGITVIFIMLSITYKRNVFRHALLTYIGLSIALISTLSMIRNLQENNIIFQLIRVDYFSILYTILIIISSVSSSILGSAWLSYYPTSRKDEFYLLLLISCMGCILLTITNHLMMLFLGIQLVTIPLFGLISYAFFQRKSIESGIKYIILSGISSSFLLFGIAFIYCETGCLSFFDIKEILLIYSNNESIFYKSSVLLIITGLSMMMVGIGFKLSLVPFHVWTPDVYQGASSAVSMYLTTSGKIAIISVFMRFLLILPEQYNRVFCLFLVISSCFSMLLGSLIAIQQDNIKRILAYSSITHAGYLLMLLIASRVNHDPIIIKEGISIYVISYLISNIGIFGVINIISFAYIENKKKDADMISLYRGLYWRSSGLSIILTILILSLAGIPLTFGFIGKFYLLLIGINNKLWLLTILVIISSIISMFYYLKIMINLFLRPINNNIYINDNFLSAWFTKPEGWLVIASVIVTLIFGLFPQFIIYLIHLIK